MKNAISIYPAGEKIVFIKGPSEIYTSYRENFALTYYLTFTKTSEIFRKNVFSIKS